MVPPATPSLAAAARPGLRLGRYVLRERIGAGGMGEVYRAWQDAPGGIRRGVVVKVIRPDRLVDPDATRGFVEEARVWMCLHHPHVVDVYDVGQEDGMWFLVLAEVEGSALGGLLRRGGPLAADEAALVVADIADALDHVHTRAGEDGRPLHLVHRDVCPANILMDGRGEARLTDFGIARAAGTVLGVEGHLPYLAPEQAQVGHVGPAADVWALGMVWWEAVAGAPALGRRGREAILAALRSEPVPLPAPPAVPAAHGEWLARCLAAVPAARPAAGELRDALRALVPATPALRRGIGARARGAEPASSAAEDAPTVHASGSGATASTAQRSDTAATTLDPSPTIALAAPFAPAAQRPVSRSQEARHRGLAAAALLGAGLVGAALLLALRPGPPPVAASAPVGAPARAAAPPPGAVPVSSSAAAPPPTARPAPPVAPATPAAAPPPTPAAPPPRPALAPAVAPPAPGPAPAPAAPSVSAAPAAAPALSLPAPAAAPAELRVEVHGDFARVCVDGACQRRPVRNATLPLAPGSHRVEAELRTSGRRVVEELTLAPGEVRTLRIEGDPASLVTPSGGAP